MLVGKTIPFVTGSQLTSSANNVNSTYTVPYRTIQREDVDITLRLPQKLARLEQSHLRFNKKLNQLQRLKLVVKASALISVALKPMS